MKKKNNEYRKYRIFGTIGMIGLFLMGTIVGITVSGISVFNNTVKPRIIQKITNTETFVLPERTCEKIEKTLLPKLDCADEKICDDTFAHISDAKLYANLSERGCPENSVKYKELAKQELEIARALNDGDMQGYQGQQESVEIVETYKRLQMQAEAERMIEKAKKLTNPAIDFIIQLEKIIEED